MPDSSDEHQQDRFSSEDSIKAMLMHPGDTAREAVAVPKSPMTINDIHLRLLRAVDEGRLESGRNAEARLPEPERSLSESQITAIVATCRRPYDGIA